MEKWKKKFSRTESSSFHINTGRIQIESISREKIIKMKVSTVFIIIIVPAALANYRIKTVKPGYVIEDLGILLTQNKQIQVNIIFDKSELTGAKENLKNFSKTISHMCANRTSEVCTHKPTQTWKKKRRGWLIYYSIKKKSKTPGTPETLLWEFSDEWDEYNLNIIKDNEATLENNIKENTKYITEIRSFAIEEKNTVWKKFKCWKKDLTKP